MRDGDRPHRRPLPPRTAHRRAPHMLAREPWNGLAIGLLGGSFNPAHVGHLRVAQAALKQLRLDWIWWLVSPQNPLKSRDEMAPLNERLASARGMIGAHPRMLATDIETRLGTRYTADTLSRLCQRFSRTHFVWLMGADNLAGLHRWQDWGRIFTLMPIAVFPRAPYTLRAVNSKAAHVFSAQWHSPAHLAHGGHRRTSGPGSERILGWTWIRFPMQAVSATEIRRSGLAWPPAVPMPPTNPAPRS